VSVARFVPDYPGVANLDTGSTITPPELLALFGRPPCKADLRRLREKLETLDPRLTGRIVAQDGMLSVIGEMDALRRRVRFAEGSTKASMRHATRGSEIDTSRLSSLDRKRADLEQMVLQRHAIAQGAALTNLTERRLPEAKEVIRK
jgi:hypothetical protein